LSLIIARKERNGEADGWAIQFVHELS